MQQAEPQSSVETAANTTGEENFMRFRSCGIEEIKMKVMAEPGAHKENSVFIANKEQIERAKLREKMMRNLAKKQSLEQANENAPLVNTKKELKAIIHAERKVKDPFRVKKSVTFKLKFTTAEELNSGDEIASNEGTENLDLGSNGSRQSQRRVKVIVANPTDEIKDVEKQKKHSTLSKAQRNS